MTSYWAASIAIACIVVVAVALAIWIVRQYKHVADRPTGKVMIFLHAASGVAIMSMGVIEIAIDGFWPVGDEPLMLPCAGIIVGIGGVVGAVLTGVRLKQLERRESNQ